MLASPRRPSPFLRALALPALLAVVALPARASEVFSKAPAAVASLNASSWVTPDGSDSDWYAWDDFTLAETQTITEVRWRGGYSNGATLGGHVSDFRVSFFNSIAGGSQPVITALPDHEDGETVIATFHTHDSANETLVGTFNGITLYDYRFKLPTPVTLQGGVKYWFRVVGSQVVYPDWGMATSTNGSHFKFSTGLSMFQNWQHDLAFSLHAQWADLGHALAGTAGKPHLTGTGTLAAGSSDSLQLGSARPSSPATLVLGTGQLNAPLKGGVLVPSPLLLVMLVTDGTGSLGLPFVMPAGVPSGTDLVLQAWITDPLAPKGVAASNGLAGTTP